MIRLSATPSPLGTNHERMFTFKLPKCKTVSSVQMALDHALRRRFR